MAITINTGVVTEGSFTDQDQFNRCGSIRDDVFSIVDRTRSKQVQIECSGLTAGTTVVLTPPATSGNLMVSGSMVEAFGGMYEAPTNKTYVLDQSAAYAYSVETLTAKLASGTCTAKLTIDGVDIGGISAVSCTSAEATGTASSANSVPVGATLALVISAGASPVDLGFTVKLTRA